MPPGFPSVLLGNICSAASFAGGKKEPEDATLNKYSLEAYVKTMGPWAIYTPIRGTSTSTAMLLNQEISWPCFFGTGYPGYSIFRQIQLAYFSIPEGTFRESTGPLGEEMDKKNPNLELCTESLAIFSSIDMSEHVPWSKSFQELDHGKIQS